MFLLFMVSHSFADSAGGMQLAVAKANKAYVAGAFESAVASYLKVTETGYGSPELYYNLGNAYFKMNNYPKAVLWYERARRLDPSSEDINYNLSVANTKISDKIEPLPELFLKRWYRNFLLIFPLDIWAMICVLAFIAGLSGMVLYIVSRVLILRKIGFWSGTVLLLVAVISLALSWNVYSLSRSTSEAIVFSPTITVKSSPDDKSTDLFVLHEGTKVTLLDNISGWYEIRIANGSVGWLPVNSLEKI